MQQKWVSDATELRNVNHEIQAGHFGKPLAGSPTSGLGDGISIQLVFNHGPYFRHVYHTKGK